MFCEKCKKKTTVRFIGKMQLCQQCAVEFKNYLQDYKEKVRHFGDLDMSLTDEYYTMNEIHQEVNSDQWFNIIKARNKKYPT